MAIATSIELGTAGGGTLFVGAFLLAFRAIIPTIAGAAVTYGIQSLKGRSFYKSISAIWLPDLDLRPPFDL